MSARQYLGARYRGLHEPLRSERRLELALLGLLLLLLLSAGSVVLQASRQQKIEPISPAAGSLRVSEVLRPASVAAAQSEEFQLRPMFWPQRRPMLGSSSALVAEVDLKNGDVPAAPPLKDLQLLGVFGSGSGGGAIVSINRQQLRLAIGEEVQGWKLSSVSTNLAIFSSGGARDVYELLPQVIASTPSAAGGGDVTEGADKVGVVQEVEPEASLSLGGRGG